MYSGTTSISDGIFLARNCWYAIFWMISVGSLSLVWSLLRLRRVQESSSYQKIGTDLGGTKHYALYTMYYILCTMHYCWLRGHLTTGAGPLQGGHHDLFLCLPRYCVKTVTKIDLCLSKNQDRPVPLKEHSQTSLEHMPTCCLDDTLYLNVLCFSCVSVSWDCCFYSPWKRNPQ